VPRVAVVLLALGGACVSGSTAADPLAVDQEVSRLLRPFQIDRGVVCDELLIEITANFNEMVGHPAVDPRSQRLTRTVREGFVDYHWVNLPGAPPGHFLFKIVGTEQHGVAPTEFAALQSARLRVYGGGHELTFGVIARGQVTAEEATAQGRERRDVEEFRIADGKVSFN
jgi:hypothetical protein